jgi:hypothetical protein
VLVIAVGTRAAEPVFLNFVSLLHQMYGESQGIRFLFTTCFKFHRRRLGFCCDLNWETSQLYPEI